MKKYWEFQAETDANIGKITILSTLIFHIVFVGLVFNWKLLVELVFFTILVFIVHRLGERSSDNQWKELIKNKKLSSR